MRRALVVLAVGMASTAAFLGFMAAGPAGSSNLDEETRAIGSSLKCPVCHDLSVADSPAPVAAEMRAQIRSKLQAGESPDQIRQDFVASYGPSILLTPPARGFDLSLWVAPALLALGALVLLLLSLRRWTRHIPKAPDADRPLSKRDRELLERVLSGVLPE